MSETMVFYKNFSKKLNSTKQPSGGDTKTVDLKKPTSIEAPVVTLSNYDLDYTYMQWNGRYYYIDDIIIVHTNIAEYHCHIDRMATFKSLIGSSTQYVTRAASAYNPMIIDGIYPTRADCTVNTLLLNKLQCIEDGSVYLNTGGCYIMGIQNAHGDNNGGICYYAMSGVAMDNMLDFMFNTATFLDATDISLELQKELVNPFQYINSLMWFPFDIVPTALTTAETLQFGYWTAPTTVYGYRLNAKSLTFTTGDTLPTHPQAASRGQYLNSAPFTRRQLIFNSFGSIPLEPSYYAGAQTIALKVGVDLITGAGILEVTTPLGDVVFKTTGQIGVPCQISQVTQNVVGAGVSALGAAWSIANGSVIGFTQGIVSGLQNLLPQRQTSGNIGSCADWEQQARPMIVSTFYSQSPDDPTQLGKPLCEPRVINTLSGYVRIDNAVVDIPGTEEDKQAIINYMESGFFYE